MFVLIIDAPVKASIDVRATSLLGLDSNLPYLVVPPCESPVRVLESLHGI
jgi:hypothetical protein